MRISSYLCGLFLGVALPAAAQVHDFTNSMATSLKSINLNAATYQDTELLGSRLNGYIDSVANFNGQAWGPINIDQSMITGRQLQLAIPPNSITPAQQSVINAAIQNAASKGVRVIITPVH